MEIDFLSDFPISIRDSIIDGFQTIDGFLTTEEYNSNNDMEESRLLAPTGFI